MKAGGAAEGMGRGSRRGAARFGRRRAAVSSAPAQFVGISIDPPNQIPSLPKTFAPRAGGGAGRGIGARVVRLVGGKPVAGVVEPLLAACRAVRDQVPVLDRKPIEAAEGDATCCLLMACPRVGVVVTARISAAVGAPHHSAGVSIRSTAPASQLCVAQVGPAATPLKSRRPRSLRFGPHPTHVGQARAAPRRRTPRSNRFVYATARDHLARDLVRVLATARGADRNRRCPRLARPRGGRVGTGTNLLADGRLTTDLAIVEPLPTA